MIDQRSTEELVRIAVAGGGFTLNGAHRSTEDLVRIAVAGGGKVRLTFTGLANRTTDDLVRIAVARRGSVEFA